MRRYETADPLRRGSRRPAAGPQRRTQAGPAGLPTQAPQEGARAVRTDSRPRSLPNGVAMALPGHQSSSSTFTQPHSSLQQQSSQEGTFREFSLRCIDQDEYDSVRHHMLRFHSRKPVDPSTQFVQPIRMHRKDPRQLQIMPGSGMGDESGEGTPGPGDESTESNADGTNTRKRGTMRKRKTHQVQGGDKNEAARQLRYEEHYPWVMEDFEGRHAYASSYEAAQSDTYAILVSDGANSFKFVPIEKWYKMTPSARYATLSTEDAESRMEMSHSSRDRWLMAHLQPRGMSDQLVHEPGGGYGSLRTVVGAEEKPKFSLDEEMDYNDDELFDDDEGAPIMDGPEEDVREAEERIRHEQRQANQLIGEEDADLADLFGSESGEGNVDKQGRKVRKYLRALEKNQNYDSDDDANPYASESSSNSDDDTAAAAEFGAGGAAGADADALRRQLQLSNFRSRITTAGLPHGMVVAHLPTELLKKFQLGDWNVGVKPAPRTAESESAARSSSRAVSTASGSPENSSEGASPEGPLPPDLLTEDDIRTLIVDGESTVKDLITALRDKLRARPDENRKRLRSILMKLAHTQNGRLYLRR